MTDAEVAEILELIDVELPVALREDYLRMRDGVSVTKERRAVEAAVLGILVGVGLTAGDIGFSKAVAA